MYDTDSSTDRRCPVYGIWYMIHSSALAGPALIVTGLGSQPVLAIYAHRLRYSWIVFIHTTYNCCTKVYITNTYVPGICTTRKEYVTHISHRAVRLQVYLKHRTYSSVQ